MMIFLKRVGALSLLAVVSAASNATFTQYKYNCFDIKNPQLQDSTAGTIKNVNGFNAKDGTDFAWYANFGKSPAGKEPNGFWLVVSPGANPKGTPGQLAIFYLDASKASPTLTAYAYNGVNGDSSWKDGNGKGALADKIASSLKSTSWIKELVVRTEANGSKTLGFRINPTSINNHTPKYPGSAAWTGAEFGDNIGIWFHPVTGLQTSYGSDKFLSKFSYSGQGWYDASWIKTTRCDAVPEPAAFAALGVAGALLLARRIRSKGV